MKIDYTSYLPNEMIQYSFSFLGIRDLGRVAQVNRLWKINSESDPVWKRFLDFVPPSLRPAKDLKSWASTHYYAPTIDATLDIAELFLQKYSTVGTSFKAFFPNSPVCSLSIKKNHGHLTQKALEVFCVQGSQPEPFYIRAQLQNGSGTLFPEHIQRLLSLLN